VPHFIARHLCVPFQRGGLQKVLEVVAVKPSAEQVLAFLIRHGWTRNRTLMLRCPTDTPTKRISELHKMKLIEKRRCPKDPRYVEYRAKEVRA
jgi:hypothetical protein